MSDLAQGALIGVLFGDKFNKLEQGIQEIKSGLDQMIQLFHGVLQNAQNTKPPPVIINNGESGPIETGEPIQGFHKDEEEEVDD